MRTAEATAARPKEEGDVDRAYRRIKASVLRGEVRPGQFMAEVELARLCGTSRTPVREACNRLAQESWITHIRHKGYWVSPLSVRQIVEVYEYRELLETFAVEKAAAAATAEHLAGLRRIVELERNPRSSAREILPTNRQVHLGIAEIAGNGRIVDQLRVTLEFVERLDMLYLESTKQLGSGSTRRGPSAPPQVPTRSPHFDLLSAVPSLPGACTERADVAERSEATSRVEVGHEEIVRALEERDPRAARRAMAAHIDDARDRMMKLVGA